MVLAILDPSQYYYIVRRPILYLPHMAAIHIISMLLIIWQHDNIRPYIRYNMHNHHIVAIQYDYPHIVTIQYRDHRIGSILFDLGCPDVKWATYRHHEDLKWNNVEKWSFLFFLRVFFSLDGTCGMPNLSPCVCYCCYPAERHLWFGRLLI